MKGDVKDNFSPIGNREHFGVQDIQPLVVKLAPPIPRHSSDSPACYAPDSTARVTGGYLSSYRDLESTTAILLTTVLSETCKPIALFGHARGPRVALETRTCRTNRLCETHPRPRVS